MSFLNRSEPRLSGKVEANEALSFGLDPLVFGRLPNLAVPQLIGRK
jgi:hypothetical protein